MLNKDYMIIFRCQACGTLYIPPKYLCANCGCESFNEYQASGSGKIYTFTTIYVAPELFKDQVPYHIAVIELSEGLKVTARIERAEESTPKIGDKVNFVKKDETGYWFQIAKEKFN